MNEAKKKIRVGFLSDDFIDPERVTSWSGLPFYFAKHLRAAGCEVIAIRGCNVMETFQEKVKQAYWHLFFGKRYIRGLNLKLLKSYSDSVQNQLRDSQVDVIFSASSWLVSKLETDIPIIFWTDATFATMLDFYESFSKLAPPTLKEGHEVEHAALMRCSLAIYSSKWAAESAVNDYGADPSKIRILTFGANVEKAPQKEEIPKLVAERLSNKVCELLFIGVEWKRKGANIAVQALQELEKLGIPARLRIAGCKVPKNFDLPEGVEIMGFLDKSTEEGRKKMDLLYRTSHFFILPTRAEAYGVVLSEAAAFGLPGLSTEVGGIPSVVTDDVNGKLFPLSAGGEKYAEWVASVWKNPERYRRLVLDTFEKFEKELDGSRSGERLETMINQLLSAKETKLTKSGQSSSTIRPHLTKGAYCYFLDANDFNVQSGRPKCILDTLQKRGVEWDLITPLKQINIRKRYLMKVLSMPLGHYYLEDRNEELLKSFANEVGRRLKNSEAKFIFSPGSLSVTYLETSLPIIISADATFHSMQKYYPEYSRIWGKQALRSEEWESKLLRKVALAAYASDWAAESAINHYGVSKERVTVIPSGANFGSKNTKEEVEKWIEARNKNKIKILFVGKNWKRKGGEIVLETIRHLIKRGFSIELSIIGSAPPSSVNIPAGVHLYPRLSITNPEERIRMEKLFQEAHFVFVPSEAEAYGIVFAEACAFGAIPVSRATGGIPTIIQNGENGILLHQEAGPADYADAIEEVFEDTGKYREMAMNAFSRFESTLNWDAWADKFIIHFNRVINL